MKFEKCKLYNIDFKSLSNYGNPSYWISFSDSEGRYCRGYTASNSCAGYTASNYKYCQVDQIIYLAYHFTKKGTCIIDSIQYTTPEQATTAAKIELETN